MDERPFWQRKTLKEMSRDEWESLCDRCARCCLVKLEDEKTGDVDYTNIACRLLDHGKCVCTRYEQRRALVPDCVTLTPDTVEAVAWLPSTCAYRLVAEGQELYWWHPLVSGSPETVHQAGISVRGRIVAEESAGDPEDYIVDWPT